MSYQKFVYNRVNWLNKSESLSTPLGKRNLNNMDGAIYNIANNVDVVYTELNSSKFDASKAGKVLNGMPTWNEKTGVLHFGFYDGTSFDVDFNIEKIPVKFSMDSDGIITMETADGTKWTCDLFDAIPNYVFVDSDSVQFTKVKNPDGSYTITGEVIKGSITDEYLTPNYLAQITTQAKRAETSMLSANSSATDADFNAKLAQSYAVGRNSGAREESVEDIDNAEYYASVAKAYRNQAEEMIGNYGDILAEIDKKLNIASFALNDDGYLIYNDDSTYTFTVDESGNLNWEVAE